MRKISFKDDYEYCFKTFIYEMGLDNVIMANQGNYLLRLFKQEMSVTMSQAKWLFEPEQKENFNQQTTEALRHPDFLPEFDMAVLQRSQLSDFPI